MTTTYEFTAFSEDDLVQQGTIGSGLGVGETFVMPAGATYTISTKDDDNVLSGDRDDNAKDSSGQYAVVNGVEIPNEQVYIEKYFVVKGSDGKTYYLAEIEIEDYSAPGQGDDFFTFIGDVPPAGTTLTTVDKCNSDGVKYADLSAGPLEGEGPSDPECIVIEAEDMNDHGFRTVHGDQASGGELVKLEGWDGSLSTHFDGPSAVYDLTIFAQDENDGKSKLKVFIDGVEAGIIMLDRQSDGGGSDNGGFSAFTLEGITIPDGAKIEIQAWGDDCEWVRIDKLELKPVDDIPPNEAPTFDNLPDDGIICVDENETAVIDIDASDADGDTLTYEIVGGRDAAHFTIDPDTGELSFTAPKDFENPNSGGNNNTYDVTVKVSDGKGGEEIKPLWVKVKDVDEPDPVCIVIEAEDMHLCGYSIEHNGDAHGGANIKATGSYGIAETVFNGPSGKYDLSVFSMDENDGNGAIDIFVNGHYVDTIWLDQGNDGGGGANTGSTFSEDVFQDLMLNTGDVISLVGYTNCNEFARIDKIELCQDGKTCPPDFLKLDFSGLSKGTTVSNQFDGVTITAQKSGDGAGSPNDAMIFDSNNPTGGDYDLGYNGLGNILIISEDNDASDPDDNAGGGVITFDFDAPSDLQNIRLLDIEENGGSIKLFDADGNLIKTVAIPAAGNNSNQLIDLEATDVAVMEIHLAGSGAVDDLCWKPGEPAPEPASLAGRYFCDENDNDVDDGEPGIVGAVVELLDAAGNVIATTTTDDNGDYIFTDLDAGTYAVRFAPDATGKTFVAPDVGGDDTVDSDVDPANGTTGPIMLMAGEDKKDVDAGVEDPGTATLGGRYFCDDDFDALEDSGEPGLAGLTVELLDAAGNVVDTTTTASDGSYLFTGLDAGAYSVRFQADPEGKTFVAQDVGGDDTIDSDVDPNTGQTGPVDVNIGEDVRDVDAGVSDPGTASLAGRVFCDENDNDVDDAEPGVGGVTVELLNASGTVIATEVTAADGSYEFTGLNAGDYSVRFPTEVDGKILVGANVGGDDTIDSDADQTTGETGTISLEIGERSEDNDAGIEDPGTAALKGRYFCDENDNDVDDAEPGISGARVVLLTAAGAFVAETVTADDGTYEFTGLTAGDYRVVFDPDATGKVFVAQDVGGDDTVDSDVDQTTGETGVIPVAIGQVVEDVDAGVEDPGTASLGDKVFLDTNGNGVQDSGEAGVADVEVLLLDENGTVIGTTETDALGMYLFDGLDAGTYSVQFVEPDGFDFTTPNAGGDDTVDSDALADGTTQQVTLGIGDENLTLDAGLVVENGTPNPVNDMGKGCADELIAVDVLANDSDPDGDPLTITEVNGNEIVDGQTIEVDGVFVTLSGGTLIFDGEDAYAGLNIGEEETATFTYTVDDGNGGSETADVDVTFCGDANDYDSLAATFPTNGTYQIRNDSEALPVDGTAFDIRIDGTGDDRFDGVVFERAYCLSFSDPALAAEAFADAPVIDGTFSDGKDGSVLDDDPVPQISIANGQSAADNLDLINWLIAQDFVGANANAVDGEFTDWEVQRAIWELTDSIDTDTFAGISPGFGDNADVDFLVAAALNPANEGYMPASDGLVTLIIDPTTPTAQNSQPFIIALDFEEYDCLC